VSQAGVGAVGLGQSQRRSSTKKPVGCGGVQRQCGVEYKASLASGLERGSRQYRKVGGTQPARGHCEVVRAVDGPPRGLETEDQFQGQGWDKEGVDRADPSLPSIGEQVVAQRPSPGNNKLCWRRPTGPATESRRKQWTTGHAHTNTRAGAEGHGPRASHQIAIKNSLVS
jgi:hypothetical protein